MIARWISITAAMVASILPALAVQAAAPPSRPAPAWPRTLPATMTCRMITPTGAVLTFSAETRTAGDRQQVRVVPAAGTAWPTAASGFVDPLGTASGEARIEAGGPPGGLVLDFTLRDAEGPWWGVELSRPNAKDRKRGLPVALGSCSAPGGPESGAIRHPAVTARGDFFDPAAWPGQCHVLARDGRMTSIKVFRGDSESGGFVVLDDGIWPRGRRTVRQMYLPVPPPRGDVQVEIVTWGPGETTGWLMVLRDEAVRAVVLTVDFFELGGPAGDGRGYAICGFHPRSSQEQTQ